MSVRGLTPPDGEARSLLSSRDRLLREIGRNVRLGKLLKERLADPLVPSLRLVSKLVFVAKDVHMLWLPSLGNVLSLIWQVLDFQLHVCNSLD